MLYIIYIYLNHTISHIIYISHTHAYTNTPNIELFRTYLCKHPVSTYEVGVSSTQMTDMMAKTTKKDSNSNGKDGNKSKSTRKEKGKKKKK